MDQVIQKYFWVIAAVVTAFNAFNLKKGLLQKVKSNPEQSGLEAGINSLFRAYLIWLTIPWFVMGAGCTIGGVPGVLSYFKPREGNAYVLAFFGSIILMWLQAEYWLFFRNGAETLVKYFKPYSSSFSSPGKVKLFGILILFAGAFVLAIFWNL